MGALDQYVKAIARKYDKGNATEHTYRECLSSLSSGILKPSFELTNEPKRQACGAPDYILESGGIPAGYIEAKDVSTSLDKVESGEQMSRYLHSLDNLILTDYLEFRFFRKGEKVSSVRIAKIQKGKIVGIAEEFDRFIALYKDFSQYTVDTIKDSKQLADMMARKAVLVKDVFSKILSSDEESGLHDQYEAFKKVLLHDVSAEEFADIYAETIAYGLFTARLHDKTPDTFSREEAYRLIPRSNPFLRELFTYVGTKLDDRAEWIVDELCDVFRATDVQKMLASFNRGTGRDDPFLHFYETFLGAYNPAKKEARGVWYTPEAVVQFIVKSVDEVLVTKFGLPQGLADTSTTTIKVEVPSGDKRTKKTTVLVDKVVPKVQILDVATGTGTFLAETIVQIHNRFAGQQGKWSSYVEQHLIPRLFGFELLMASYAMCHMKLELLLAETGYKSKATHPPRLNVYLTNSLHKAHEEVDKLPLIEWFSRESNEASYIKTYTPVMVAIGNPPYRGITSNKGELIVNIDDYKYVDGIHFGEKKHWLHDDYVKFIRLGEYFVNKSGQGVMGYITNHGYIDNPTFRGMRWHLLRSFSEIYILDLHGNSNKLEKNPTGGSDSNVFDIQQGVSILVAIRHADKDPKSLASVFHSEAWGSRESKYDFLSENTLSSVAWEALTPEAPFYYFVPRSNKGAAEYKDGFSVKDLFPVSGAGIVTARDEFSIDIDEADLFARLSRASKMGVEEAREQYDLRKDVESWHVEWALDDLKNTGPSKKRIQQLLYRPFDKRYIYYTDRSGGVLARPNSRLMEHMISGENIALIVPKQSHGSLGAFATRGLAAHKSFDAYNINTLFPLYINEANALLSGRTPNLDSKIWSKIKKVAGADARDPQRIFDYVYAVVHAKGYYDAYEQFLKSGFPIVPYPRDAEFFTSMADLGARLRALHLLEAGTGSIGEQVAAFPVEGNDVVEIAEHDDGKIWINGTQFFDAIPKAAWLMRVGGYVPARKWLLDRRGRTLSFDEINHYQSVLRSLVEILDVLPAIDDVYTA